MLQIRKIQPHEKTVLDAIVRIHLDTFPGFFLTFMGKGFLKNMYLCYCLHAPSGLYAAFDGDKPVGFLAFSSQMSELYKFMLKTRLLAFGWYSFLAFLRKPAVFIRLLRAFLKPGESKREERYVELSSIGVSPEAKNKGIGSMLVQKLKDDTDLTEFQYINLETDAVDNEAANCFYQKNGFCLHRTYTTPEGRRMNEYRCTENGT